MDNSENIKNDARIISEEILGRIKRAKTASCEETPMTDAPPMLFVAFPLNEDDPNYEAASRYCSELGLSQVVNIGFTPLFSEENPVDAMRETIKQLAGNMKLSFLFMVAEGYMKPMGEAEVFDHERGSLEKDFSENPFSEVREGIIVSGVDWDTTSLWTISTTYRYDDFGVPTYDEPDSAETAIDDKFLNGEAGLVPTILAGGMALIRTAWEVMGFAQQVMNQEPKHDKEGGE